MTNWEELHRRCMGCQKCALADTRTNVVFGKGPRDARDRKSTRLNSSH